MRRSTYLICYDIADRKRLVKVAKRMEDAGRRLQRSVFVALLSERARAALRADLEELIHPKHDQVLFFPLCDACCDRIDALGMSHQPLPHEYGSYLIGGGEAACI